MKPVSGWCDFTCCKIRGIYKSVFYLTKLHLKSKRHHMVIQISPEELQKMKQVLLDEDLKEALDLIKIFHKRLMAQENKGMKSHLDKQ